MNSVNQIFSGLIGLFLFACLITLVIYWIAFPIMVTKYLKQMLQSQQAIHRALLAGNTVQDEIAKALQWMVNNWRDDSKPPPPSA